MIIQVDTREHSDERRRVEGQIHKLGVKTIRSKLYIGDYMSLDNAYLVIDRKKDLLELCQNITQGHERLRNEFLRARGINAQIVILCEHGDGIERLSDVNFWHNPRLDETKTIVDEQGRRWLVKAYPKATNGPQLYKSLETIRRRYGVEFVFCNKKQTGAMIVDILRRGQP